MHRLTQFADLFRNLVTKPVETTIELLSWPLWFLDMLKRNKPLRNAIIYTTLVSGAVIFFFGFQIWVMGIMTIGQMALTMVMMIGQMVVLFTFLSSTKTVKLVPGQDGLFTFEKDYYGQEVLVNTIKQWVTSLSREGKAMLDYMGAEAIHGLILKGPPGTGKTLLAQCIASFANAAFFGTSGTDYQAMFIGVGPMKIMKMYGNARKEAARYGAAIVFIDEIDSIGGNRGGVAGASGNSLGGMLGGGGLGVLSKLLTELDGTKESGRRFEITNSLRGIVGLPEITGGLVFTIGATNRFDALDPALIRPGRIDKVIEVPAPDKYSRRLIIEGYLGKVLHDAEDIDLDGMVEDTAGVTPAQLASAIQRSAPRYAIGDNRLYITQSDIDSALQEDLVGLANPIADWNPDQKRSVAVHEAGHAVVARVVRRDKRITTVSIIRRGAGILGYVMDVETEEIFAQPLTRLSANLMVSLAGNYAVEVVMGEKWTGMVGGDDKNVRFYLHAMAMAGLFGGIPFQLGPAGQDPFVQKRIRERADRYLQQAIQGTRAMIRDNRDFLDEVTEALIEKDELTSRDFYEIAGRYTE